MKKDEKKKKNIKWLLYLILGGFLVKLFKFFMKNKKQIKGNFKDFVDEEKKEIKELKQGEESFSKYCKDSFSILGNYFIPNNKNNNKPKMLHTKSLVVIAVVLVALKLSIAGYLFLEYPNEAKMSEIITEKVFELTNEARINNNLSPLNISTVLSASASAKAQDMVINNYFAHHSPDGKKPWDWINRNNYSYLFVGENLAMNFSEAKTAHNALMKSPTHKKNILNPRFSDMGLAVITGKVNGKNTNILVEFFATRKETIKEVPVKKEIKPEAGILEVPKEKAKTDVLGIEEEIKEENIVEEKKTQEEPLEKDVPEETAPTPIIANTETPSPSPNLELELTPNTNITYFETEDISEFNVASTLVKTSQYIYIGVLVLVILVFSLNIFIRITVQHKPVIIQTILLLILITGLISIDFHFMENIFNGVAII